MTADVWFLAALIFAAALMYSSVGHAGASGYLVAMALFGMAPEEMRPTALILNIIVATIGAARFYRAGSFNWRLILLFSAGSIPMAWLGGRMTLPPEVYRPVLGVILFAAAARFFFEPRPAAAETVRRAPAWLAVAVGAGIGLLSGLTGTGGGIFLSPLILLLKWARTKETSGIAVTFILFNSISGLAGRVSHTATLPEGIWVWAAAAAIGGLLGSEAGSRWLGNRTLRRLLAIVLVVAGLKLILTSFPAPGSSYAIHRGVIAGREFHSRS